MSLSFVQLADSYGKASKNGSVIYMDRNAKNEEAHLPALDVRYRKPDALADHLLAIGKDCAAHLKEPFKSTDHGALLYGEDGLPR